MQNQVESFPKTILWLWYRLNTSSLLFLVTIVWRPRLFREEISNLVSTPDTRSILLCEILQTLSAMRNQIVEDSVGEGGVEGTEGGSRQKSMPQKISLCQSNWLGVNDSSNTVFLLRHPRGYICEVLQCLVYLLEVHCTYISNSTKKIYKALIG